MEKSSHIQAQGAIVQLANLFADDPCVATSNTGLHRDPGVIFKKGKCVKTADGAPDYFSRTVRQACIHCRTTFHPCEDLRAVALCKLSAYRDKEGLRRQACDGVLAVDANEVIR